MIRKRTKQGAMKRADDQTIRDLLGINSDDAHNFSAELDERDDGTVVVHLDSPIERQAVFELELPEDIRSMSDEELRSTNLDDLPDEIPLSFSSEIPVMRWGEDEILSHEKGDADFRRLKNVGAMLKNHSPNSIIGRPKKVWLDEESRRGLAIAMFGTTPEAQKAKREVLIDKSLKGVSVGYIVSQYVFLKDKDVVYKGRITGPAYVATKWSALEFSLTPIAADPSVGVGRQIEKSKPKEKTMDAKFRAWLVGKAIDPEGIDEVTLARLQKEYDEEQAKLRAPAPPPPVVAAVVPPPVPAETVIQAAPDANAIREEARRAEATRVSEILALCGTHGIEETARNEMINGNQTVDQVRATILSQLAGDHSSMGGRVTVQTDGRETFGRAAIEGLQIKTGSVNRRDAKEGGEVVAVFTLRELARESLKRANMTIPANVNDMIRSAMRGPAITQDDIERYSRGEAIISGTTSDFPYILAATANKSMLAAYGTARTSFERWCKIGSLSDFKETNRVKLSEAGDLTLVLEGGHYDETALSEDQNPIQVYTYGLKFNLSRQAIINDDMDAFTTVPGKLGRSAKRLPNILAVVALCANAVMNDTNRVFSAAHNNLSASANYALDTLAHAVDGIKNMQAMLDSQQGMIHAIAAENTKTLTLGLELEVLLVGTADQAFYARQVVQSSTNPTQSNVGVVNPLEGAAEVVKEPLIADNGITGYSQTQFFGFGDKNDVPVIEVAFLNGVQEPFMEEVDQTDADGRVYKVRLDCGAAPVDYAGAARENGV